MHVSRLRTRALGHLRARLLGPEPSPAPELAACQDPAGNPSARRSAGAARCMGRAVGVA
jgi:hypothetical protein